MRSTRRPSLWTRAVLPLVALALIEPMLAQPLAVVPYPERYQSSLVKYAVVERSDGFARDLYASPDVIEALKGNPHLQELPVGALLALDVHSAAVVGRDRKTGAPTFETTPQGRLVRSKDERTHQAARTGPSPDSIR